MHSAQVLGQAHIAVDYMKFENLALAAIGLDDPDNEDGGWMPQNIKNARSGRQRLCDAFWKWRATLLSLARRCAASSSPVPSSRLSRGKIAATKIQAPSFGFGSQSPFSSYLLFPYHYESADDSYPTSPLMKGRPVQMLATDALNRLLDSAMLKTLPPVGMTEQTQQFATSRAGRRFIRARCGARPIRTRSRRIREVGGDPAALAPMFTQALSLYAELTGVLPDGWARRRTATPRPSPRTRSCSAARCAPSIMSIQPARADDCAGWIWPIRWAAMP
jgi:hypothetical protein